MKLSLQAWFCLALIIIAFIGGCKLGCNHGMKIASKGTQSQSVTVRDSIVYVTIHDTIESKSTPTITGVKKSKSSSYIPPYVVYPTQPNDYVSSKDTVCESKLNESISYVDTLTLSDSASYVVVKDTVTGNRIQGRSFTSFIKSKIEYKTTEIKVERKPRMAILVGAEIIANSRSLNYTGIAAGLKMRSGNLYTIGAGLVKSEIFYKAGVLFKLGK